MGYIHIGSLSLPIPFGSGSKVKQKQLSDFLKPEPVIKPKSTLSTQTQTILTSEVDEVSTDIHQQTTLVITDEPALPQEVDTDKLFVMQYLSSKELSEEKEHSPPTELEKESTLIQEVGFIPAKKFKSKPSTLKSKWQKKLETPLVEKTAVFLLISLQILAPIAVLIFFGFLFVAILFPSVFVGSVVYPPGYNESLSNITNTTPSTSPLPMNTSIYGSQPVPTQPSNVVVVTLPPESSVVHQSTPTPTPPVPVTPPVTTPPVVTTPPSNTVTYYVQDEKGISHDVTDIPDTLRYQAKYSCYWSIRDKGMGKYLSVEAVCQGADTGLWIEACDCSTYMQQHP